jgi:hypothetical protein
MGRDVAALTATGPPAELGERLGEYPVSVVGRMLVRSAATGVTCAPPVA